MTYEEFIDELRRLIVEGDALLNSGRATHHTPAFRNWKHQTRSIVDTAARSHELPGTFGGHRAYQAMWAGASSSEDADAFSRDMGDALNELRYLVEQFEKFSEPGPKSAPGRAASARAAGPSTVNIHGPVGTVQAGAHATAHVCIDAGSARLVEALETLQAAIRQAADMGAREREESAELTADVVAAVKVPRPNSLKLTGLLNGLATGIQSVASVQGAWTAVRAAAAFFGIALP